MPTATPTNNNNDTDGEQQLRLRKPANTAFKQQRLKAWQPILTPKAVLPTFFLLGLIFIPLGAVLYVVSNNVDEFKFDYTRCESATSSLTAPTDPSIAPGVDKWSYNQNTKLCTVEFTIPKTFTAPVYLYYRLTNFYQNHRRYVRSFSAAQLSGQALAKTSLTECDPLGANPDGLPYYPCGLIANSIFNDTIGVQNVNFEQFTAQFLGSDTNSTVSQYPFSAKGISWPSDADKYGASSYDMSQAAPPLSWKKYKGKTLNGTWAAGGVTFNPTTDEHFQVWMRTAGLPSFRKLYGKNTEQDLKQGKYRIEISYEFPVLPYDGTKSIVFSTASWLGGKNPFLGIAYMTVGSICIVLGVIFLLKHQISPRKLGDHTYLSWNQPQIPAITPSSAGTN